MIREIAKSFPFVELMDTWTWFQSGINTDGAHNPVTSRKVKRGDILSLNCFPMVAGYYVALERTLFAETASKEHIRLWEINCKVHDEGKKLLKPGNKCSDIAKTLKIERDLLVDLLGLGRGDDVVGHGGERSKIPFEIPTRRADRWPRSFVGARRHLPTVPAPSPCAVAPMKARNVR